MRKLEKTLKALANKRRLTIIKYLKKNREASVGEIAGAIRLFFRSTSKHLSVLSAADILEKEQKSTLVFYRLSDSLSQTARSIISCIK